MVSRRRFLGAGGFGMLALSAGLSSTLPLHSASGEDLWTDQLHRKAMLKPLKERLLGYPINMNDPPDDFFRWRAELSAVGIDQFAFNNVGNPFKTSPIAYNTHDFERDVILRFGKLFGFPADDIWGFLSHSGTDSNMHGMYLGRTILKGRTGVLPKAYFTHEAHYSVQILRDLLGLDAVMVSTLPDGGMDSRDLSEKLHQHPNAPALVVATVGTTFKGAVDDVDAIRQTLRGTESYLHVDAALFGGYLPFTKHAAEVAYPSDEAPEAGRYDSIAVSCHKFFGFPSPAGLFVTKQTLYDEFNEGFSKVHDPEYIHQVPGTITCSRDAVKPAEFYFFTTPPALARQREDAQRMLANTDYLLEQMRRHFPQLVATRSNRMSNTLYFRDPGDAIIKKYSLATMTLEVDKQPTKHAHAIIMPHVSKGVLAEFLADLEKLRKR